MNKRVNTEALDRLVQRWIDERLLPGAVLDISVGSHFRWSKAYGAYSDGTGIRKVTEDTLFDAASLTKVAVTLPVIMKLESQGLLRLDDPVQRYLPDFRHAGVTLRHLLKHVSGLPAGISGVVRDRPCDVLPLLFAEELVHPPGERVLYSDLGMILLGEIASGLTGLTLDACAREFVFEPLGMTDSMFNPPSSLLYRIAATEPFGDGYVHGVVHDEKSFHMGGVCGSAGLFTTAGDLHTYARAWLDPDRHQLLSRDKIDECLADPFDGRGLGWEIWHGQQQVPSCGALWPHGSFGHTGFTGTSLWVDPTHELIVVFLTHAVHFGRNHSLRRLRPILHDTVYTSLT